MSKEYVDDAEVERIGIAMLGKHFNFCEQPLIKFLKVITEKSSFLGKCSKATGEWQYLTDKDYVITVWGKWWDEATEEQKKALMFHELSHIICQEKDDGTICWKMKKHDVEEFNDVVSEYGLWEESLVNFNRSANAKKQ